MADSRLLIDNSSLALFVEYTPSTKRTRRCSKASQLALNYLDISHRVLPHNVSRQVKLVKRFRRFTHPRFHTQIKITQYMSYFFVPVPLFRRNGSFNKASISSRVIPGNTQLSCLVYSIRLILTPSSYTVRDGPDTTPFQTQRVDRIRFLTVTKVKSKTPESSSETCKPVYTSEHSTMFHFHSDYKVCM